MDPPIVTDEQILRETLGNFQAVRLAIGARYKWFIHITRTANMAGIRQNGLLPHTDAPPPREVVEVLGDTAANITCLSPLGADLVPGPVGEGPFVCLAIENNALPPRIGLDWSYDGAVGIARVLRDEQRDSSVGEIFAAAVKRWGSMVVYDRIPPTDLRVYANGYFPLAPQHWPMLTNTADGDLAIFGAK